MIKENKQYLALVDDMDRQWGKLEKMEVHRLGLLHRAFSIFLFNSKGELLLQQRADEKYHSAGLWTNTCCSHPEFGEAMQDAVDRRLREEMGMEAQTHFVFSFIYKARLDNGLTEHEFDHVYIGISNTPPEPDKSEVKDWKYMSVEEIKKDLEQQPWLYTVWFGICFDKVAAYHHRLFGVPYGV